MKRIVLRIAQATTSGGLLFGLLGSGCEADILRIVTPLLF